MLFEYEDIQKFNEWVSKHPGLGIILFLGAIAFLVGLAYISNYLERREFMQQYKKGKR